MSNISDDAFSDFIGNAVKRHEPTTGYQQEEFEELKYHGLTPKGSILRIVGAPAVAKEKKLGDSVELNYAEVLDDKGKIIQLKLPTNGTEEAENHVIWNMIKKIKEATYVNKIKVFRYEQQYPLLFNKIVKGGYDPVKQAPQHKFSKGWEGQTISVFNCIDRSDMDWHRTNNKTKVLSKQITLSPSKTEPGKINEFISKGVPSYGFILPLSSIVSKYGNWENYDILIKKTGIPTQPYEMINATKMMAAGLSEEIPVELQTFVSKNEFLTEEEQNFVRFDLEKAFKTTSYNKILSRLGETIKLFDNTFGTTYFSKVKELAEIEKESRAKEQVENNVEDNKPLDEKNSLNEEITTEPTEVREQSQPRRVPSRQTEEESSYFLSADDISKIKGWDSLNEDSKKAISKVVDLNGKITLEFNNVTPENQVAACPDCGTVAPMSFSHCPYCAIQF